MDVDEHVVQGRGASAVSEYNAEASSTAGAAVSPKQAARNARDVERLRRQILADPEAFFKKADADRSNDVSWDEWKETCSALVHEIDDAAMRLLFDEIAEDNRISYAQLLEMVEAHRLVKCFVEESRCKEALEGSLMRMVARKRVSQKNVGGGRRWADQVLEMLADITEEDGRSLVESSGVAAALCENAAAARDKMQKDEDARPQTWKEEMDKFALLPTSAYGGIEDFYRGLETLLGWPRANVLKEMQEEFLKMKDSKKVYQAWNSGLNETTSFIEWYCVVDPFEPDTVCKDKSPKEWTPRHQYGGQRWPIRL